VLTGLWQMGTRMRERGDRRGVYVQQIVRALRPLERSGARKAFVHTLRSVIDVRGQRVSATDRLYLLTDFPTLIVWGERDNTIPLAHGREAHEAIPGSVFRTLPKAAHFPHLEDPDSLATVLREFLDSTKAAHWSDGDWGGIISPRAPRSRRRRGAVA
jgi:pimeloyl-ACP methyl ester carboxylesterase